MIDRVLDARIRAGLPPVPPCSSCDKPAVGYRSWPDGTFVAWCAEHIDSEAQTSLYVNDESPTDERKHRNAH